MISSNIILLSVVGLLLVILLKILQSGKPTGIHLFVDKFADTYETTDYNTYGRLTTDYSAWNNGEVTILVLGTITFNNYLFNWGKRGMPIYVEIENHTPPHLEIYLESPKDTRAFVPNSTMELPHICKKGRLFKFRVRFKEEMARSLQKPIRLTFQVSASYNTSKLFFKAAGSSTISHQLHIGPDLGSVWLGLDPGTNGSCIAGGTNSEDIFITNEKGEDEPKPRITPSIINIVKSRDASNPYTSNQELHPDLYEWGDEAASRINRKRSRTFQSVKKLLGFKDEQHIVMNNGTVLTVDGILLSSALVKGIFQEFQQHIESQPKKYEEFLETNRKFQPKRAVVAVPNNFTAVKIQDMIECVRRAGDFQEIRFISEAEATLGYYIYLHDEFNKKGNQYGTKGLKDETILIFDMGGATINLTLSEVYTETTQLDDLEFHLKMIAKLGYGIGGDTIDWCLAQFFWRFHNDYPSLRNFNPFTDLSRLPLEERNIQAKKRMFVQQKMEYLKKRITYNYYNKADLLLTGVEIAQAFKELSESFANINQQYLKKQNSPNITHPSNTVPSVQFRVVVGANDLINQYLRRNKDGTYLFFKDKLLQKFVYQPIQDTVKEFFSLLEMSFLDTVIFSGRTTQFPLIKETVMQLLGKIEKKNNDPKAKIEYINPHIVHLKGNNLKSAVAIGACWYGVNRAGIVLKNKMISSSFGIKKTVSPRKNDLDFLKLIEMDQAFIQPKLVVRPDSIPSKDQQVAYVEGGKSNLNDLFSFDSQKVVFYQVMGQNAKEILQLAQKHKYAKLTAIKINHRVNRVYIKVFENDNIYCEVIDVHGTPLNAETMVKDQDIYDANEEHYTWIVN